MKVLHSAALLTPPSGIINQMRWEQQAADSIGIDWTTKIFCPKGSVEKERIVRESDHLLSGPCTKLKKLYNWIALRREYYSWLMSLEDQYDVFLLRYYVHDPLQLKFVSQCKKPVYFVHHTLEIIELATAGGASAPIRAGLEWLFGRYALRKATGLIGVTQEIIDYQRDRARIPDKTAHLYPNGIVFDEPEVEDHRSDVPELLFVAGNFSPWHGLDLLLDSIRENDDEFILHLVGNIPDSYMAIINEDSRVIIHGVQNKNEIREISRSCWLGLSSFALYRNNMRQACTLKVREYLMMGLPVYAGHEDVFDPSYMYFSSSSADIKNVLRFCHVVKGCERRDVRDSARNYVDKGVLLEMLNRQIVDDSLSQ